MTQPDGGTETQDSSGQAPAHRRNSVSLDDKYDLNQQRVFITGAQAIVRLLLMQKERDRQAGLNTAGFATGYRGSPLGSLDMQLQAAARHLTPADIKFIPGLNEDLAATAIWGTQQAEMRGEGKFDGVFGLWYGKGPGVDRSGDVFRHANLAGTSPNGGVIALMGDDHTAESSTTAHQSEFHFVDVMMPVLHPAGVQEIIDYGLLGWSLSRYASVWVGIKLIKDTVESTGSIDSSLNRVTPVIPDDFDMPKGGLNIRARDPVLAQEARLQDYKRDAIVAWLRANKLNEIIISGGPKAKVGVITTGKPYLDVRQALDDLGIDEKRANDLGLRLYKIGCPWPLEPDGLKEFVKDLDLVICVEEKRALIEVQLREELYGTDNQPICVGKKDEEGNWLFPVKGALDANEVAIAIGERLLRFNESDQELAARVTELKEFQQRLSQTQDAALRVPYFCSGCPHNSSTKIPDGSRAYAGIGCHYMVQWMDRGTEGFTQMGGEGANWVGEAPFSKRDHVFQNIGDGTLNHSGLLAIRWAVAAGTNITYKILYNDAVAMTGGQQNDGGLDVGKIARLMEAEGIQRIAIVSDEPERYDSSFGFPARATINHRDELDTVQKEMAGVKGCSVLIYDQTCAAEKRRRRKRGTFPDPAKRVLINPLVCEGCGDCGEKSNCVSVQPLDTEFGRKRTIDQSSCNKDYSCVNGFCPSFVTVHGGTLKARNFSADASLLDGLPKLPRPEIPKLGADPYGILVTGVGGTGVVTIGAIIGMAAHIEGKGCGAIDMAGLAQKGGAVYSHVKLSESPETIHAIRVAAGQADLVLGCDLVVSGSKKVLAAVRKGKTGVVVNLEEIYPGDFARNADYSLPAARIRRALLDHAGDKALFVDATRIATALLGNSIATNMFMLGYAWQKGLVPLDAEPIEQSIELNGQAIAMNRTAFSLGRHYAEHPDSVRALAPSLSIDAEQAGEPAQDQTREQSLTKLVEHRAELLTAYQNKAYADRYRAQVEKIRQAESSRTPGLDGLTEAVARYLFKLMAIKDEYEVARLYTDGTFARQVSETFDGPVKLQFYLAPPIFSRRDPETGVPKKSAFGPWMMKGFKLLAAMKGLRSTAFDIFSYTAERKRERALLTDYETLLGEICMTLNPQNHAVAVALTEIPEKIRGYGHIKDRHIEQAKAEEATLLNTYRSGEAPVPVAAE